MLNANIFYLRDRKADRRTRKMLLLFLKKTYYCREYRAQSWQKNASMLNQSFFSNAKTLS